MTWHFLGECDGSTSTSTHIRQPCSGSWQQQTQRVTNTQRPDSFQQFRLSCVSCVLTVVCDTCLLRLPACREPNPLCRVVLLQCCRTQCAAACNVPGEHQHSTACHSTTQHSMRYVVSATSDSARVLAAADCVRILQQQTQLRHHSVCPVLVTVSRFFFSCCHTIQAAVCSLLPLAFCLLGDTAEFYIAPIMAHVSQAIPKMRPRFAGGV